MCFRKFCVKFIFLIFLEKWEGYLLIVHITSPRGDNELKVNGVQVCAGCARRHGALLYKTDLNCWQLMQPIKSIILHFIIWILVILASIDNSTHFIVNIYEGNLDYQLLLFCCDTTPYQPTYRRKGCILELRFQRAQSRFSHGREIQQQAACVRHDERNS